MCVCVFWVLCSLRQGSVFWGHYDGPGWNYLSAPSQTPLIDPQALSHSDTISPQPLHLQLLQPADLLTGMLNNIDQPYGSVFIFSEKGTTMFLKMGK